MYERERQGTLLSERSNKRSEDNQPIHQWEFDSQYSGDYPQILVLVARAYRLTS
jgi:hypothetical protein